MKVLEVMHDKTTSTMQQGIGTNHKSLQMHENTPEKLTKATWVQTKLNRNFINFNQSITRFKHRIKNIFTKSLNQTINQNIANP